MDLKKSSRGNKALLLSEIKDTITTFGKLPRRSESSSIGSISLNDSKQVILNVSSKAQGKTIDINNILNSKTADEYVIKSLIQS